MYLTVHRYTVYIEEVQGGCGPIYEPLSQSEILSEKLLFWEIKFWFVINCAPLDAYVEEVQGGVDLFMNR